MTNSTTGAPSFSKLILEADFPMDGVRLVEASAGTGKTYNIQTIFLRLVVERGLDVGRVLVVTFTEAATKELRDRLRQVLQKCRRVLEGDDLKGDQDLGRIGEVLKMASTAEATARVRQALQDFDEAAIYTIHGFCNRTLSRFAFECGHEYGAELIGECDDVIDELCEDWWRRNVYGASPTELAALGAGKVTLASLKGLAKKLIAKPDAETRPETPSSDLPSIDGLVAAVLKEWDRDSVEAILAKAPIKRQSLNTRARQTAYDHLDAAAGEVSSGLLDSLRKLTPGFLRGIRKDETFEPGDVPFFAACGALCEATAAMLPSAARSVAAEYRARRRQHNVLSYDDLLIDLRNGLLNPDSRDAILAALRAEYGAALIDEFQDTDPVQYDIFRRAFIETGLPVFLVGDPKQAIYGFRSGDIFTYYAAAEKARAARNEKSPPTLDTNYRSEERLVEAINQVFAGGFLNANIRYAGDLKADEWDESERLTVSGEPDAAPFRLGYYTDYPLASSRKQPPGLTNPYALGIYADVADEIVRLLNDDATRIAGKRVQPSDIALLVLTHREAELLHRELARRRVPAVRQSTGNVFDSLEAEDMQLLLAAVADPTHPGALRAALATELTPLSDTDLLALTEGGALGDATEDAGGPRAMEDYAALFREAGDRWRRGSSMQAVTLLIKRLGLRERVVALPDGERRLTNLLQLADLIHHAAVESRLGVDGVLNWLARQREEATREENDAFEMRLESDADAVRIMTVFKSKGLQFPIVFAPTLWRRQPGSRGDVVEYHDTWAPDAPSGVPPLVLDVSGSDDGKEKARREKREEDIRLFYVAATRAIHRVYVIWGDLYNDKGALAHVLDEGALQAANTAKSMQDEGRREGEAETCDAVWVQLRERTLRELGKPPAPYVPAEATEPPGLRDPSDAWFGVTVDKTHGHTSYSDFAPHGKTAPVEDAAESAEEEGDIPEDAPEGETGKGLTVFTFPAGKRTGNCWHAIFEKLDFPGIRDVNGEGGAEARKIVAQMLQAYGFCQDAEAPEVRVTFDMVRRTLTQPLGPDADFALADVPAEDRLAEMEFNFPLRDEPDRRVADLADVLDRHWSAETGAKKAFLEAVRASAWGSGRDRSAAIPRGFMTGYVDLVFRRDGRYYILDWKSNRRGGRPEDFDAKGIITEMAAYAYFLQYLVYTVALHKYLEGCLGVAYDYAEHFGGVFYLFLRGMDGETPGRSVFFDKPELALVEDLAKELGDFRGGER